MLSLEIIREDLRNIRYYFSRKEKLNKHFEIVGENEITNTIAKYNAAICKAPPKLYELYVYLYVEGNTQESAAEEFGYSTDYLQRMNKQLLKFLQAHMN